MQRRKEKAVVYQLKGFLENLQPTACPVLCLASAEAIQVNDDLLTFSANSEQNQKG